MALSSLLFLSFLSAPLAFVAARLLSPAFIAMVPGLLFLGFAGYSPQVTPLQAVTDSVQWLPSLGISLSLRLDGLGLLFALLITGIGTAIFLYASAYLPRTWQTPRFFATLTVFMASMLGAVMSDDLLSLLVFWELTSLSSFLLIGYQPEQTQSRRSAQQGLLITVAGGLAMLAGIVLVGSMTGTYRISELVAGAPDPVLSGTSGTLALILIAIGAFSKSAQFPLHSWLANAMVAPTPVSGYLHSATMVKLGVYLLARLSPVLSAHTVWTPLLVTVGCVTMLSAAVLALRETDLKRILAYTTIVSLGTLVTLLGLDDPVSTTAMVAFLIVHALYKASLFMVAGIIDHAVGTRNCLRLGGLARSMPVTTVIAGTASLSMAGIPPLFGFIGKELIYEAALSSELSYMAFAIVILANACMAVVAGIIVLRCFFGLPTHTDTRIGKRAAILTPPQTSTSTAPPHRSQAGDPSISMWIGPLLLAASGLAFGLIPGWIDDLLAAAAAAVEGRPVQFQLVLWHGFTPVLALSAATLMLGVGLYCCWARIRCHLQALHFIDRWGPDALYDRALTALARFAVWQTGMIQTGSLRHYMAMSLGIVAVTVLTSLGLSGGLALPSLHVKEIGIDAVLPLLLIAAAIMVLHSRGFVQGIISTGAVGFGVAVVFLLEGAPDLAFTQFSVEALSVVILLAVVGRMPFRFLDPRYTHQRRRDAVIALLFGLMFALVMFSVVSVPFNESLSNYFRAFSYPLAHGRNLVNVIIVDFRALDTLGEITVLALAALAAVAVFFSPGKQGTSQAGANTTHPGGQP